MKETTVLIQHIYLNLSNINTKIVRGRTLLPETMVWK